MDEVYEITKNNFPREELFIADKIVNCREWREDSSSAYWRKPSMRLDSEIEEILETTKELPRKISLYCDTFYINGASTIEVPAKKFSLTIYAREFIVTPSASGSSNASLTIKTTVSAPCDIGIYTPSIPDDLTLQFITGSSNSDLIKPQLGSGEVGFRVSNKDGRVKGRSTIDVAPADYLSNVTLEGVIDETVIWENDNLARLLQFQFLCATSNCQRDPEAAYKLLTYVCSMTEGNTQMVDFHYQASSLLMHISAQSSQLVSYVPQVNLSSSRALLESRLRAAQVFEERFYQFIQLEKNSKQLGSVVSLMSSASDDATRTYQFTLRTARERYNTAEKSHTEALSRFTKANAGLETAGETFKAGIKKWAEDERDKAYKEIGFALVGVVASIVGCVFTSGATAPAAAAAVEKTTGVFVKLKEVFEKLKKVYDRFEPALKKIREMATSTQKILKTLDKVKGIEGQQDIVIPSQDNKEDVANATAEWDIFKQQILSMFETLNDHDINGKREYRDKLLELPVLGKTVLASQTTLIATGDQYAVLQLKERFANNQLKRVQGCLSSVTKDERIFEIMKSVMFDRLLAIRGLVYMDFWSHTMAYMYYSMSDDLPILLSATKPAADYLDDAARLQAAIIGFGTNTRVQMKKFVVSLTDDPQTIKECLVEGNTYFFTLSHEGPLFKNFCRVRMTRARCYLEGVTTEDPTETIQLLLQTGAAFTDKDIEVSHHSRVFIGEPQKWLFECSPNDREIKCDGELVGADSCVKQTPFTDWAVEIQGDSSKLSFSDFTGLKLELWCEVTLL